MAKRAQVSPGPKKPGEMHIIKIEEFYPKDTFDSVPATEPKKPKKPNIQPIVPLEPIVPPSPSPPISFKPSEPTHEKPSRPPRSFVPVRPVEPSKPTHEKPDTKKKRPAKSRRLSKRQESLLARERRREFISKGKRARRLRGTTNNSVGSTILNKLLNKFLVFLKRTL